MKLFPSLGVRTNATSLKVSAGPFLRKGIQSSSCLVSKPVDRNCFSLPIEWTVFKLLLMMNYSLPSTNSLKAGGVNEMYSGMLSIGCPAKEAIMARGGIFPFANMPSVSLSEKHFMMSQARMKLLSSSHIYIPFCLDHCFSFNISA